MSELREKPVKGKSLIRVKYNRNSGTVMVKTEGPAASTAGTASNRSTPRGPQETQPGDEQSDLTPEYAVSVIASAVLEEPPVPPEAVWFYCVKMYEVYGTLHTACIRRAVNSGVEIKCIMGPPEASRLNRSSVRKRGRQVVALYMSELQHSILETSSGREKMQKVLKITIASAVKLARITSSVRHLLIKEDEDELPGQEASLSVNVEEENILGAAATVPLGIPTAAQVVEAEATAIISTTTKTEERNQSEETRNEDIRVLAALIQGFGELEKTLIHHRQHLQYLIYKEQMATQEECRDIFHKMLEEFLKQIQHLEEITVNLSRCVSPEGALQSPQRCARQSSPDPPAPIATSS